MSTGKSKSDRFLELMEQQDNIVILCHDNPDPDAMASGWALQYLIRQKLDKKVSLVGGGDVDRAENRHMIKLLQIPINLDGDHVFNDDDAIILVDCGPDATNHLLNNTGRTPIAVIDHHGKKLRNKNIPFKDVRPTAAAAASIVGSYLKQQEIEPHPRLATALAYAIRTEIFGSPTKLSPLDRSINKWIANWSNLSHISQIESAPVTQAYYGDLILALQNTFTYDETALCILPRAQSPEIVGEVSDMIVRCENIQRVLCGAVFDDNLLVSVRTHFGTENAASLVRKTLDGIGKGGGHQHRAGGKVSKIDEQFESRDAMESELRSRWLDANNIDQQQRGSRLIQKKEIVKNL